jgi:molybdate transport system regulatory protein
MTRKTDMQEGTVSHSASPIEHLDGVQVERLTEAFRIWNESAPSSYIRRVRGRYWLSFLLLRFTGARIGEVLRIDDATDIDFRQSEIRIVSPGSYPRKLVLRVIPVPLEVIERVLDYLSEFPAMRGRVFALDQGNFRREFYRRAEEAEIPRQYSHPHILRHTRALELLKAGVPLTIVQDLLGHALSSTTAIYLERTEITARIVLKDRGLL